jgi:hypothetical protein
MPLKHRENKDKLPMPSRQKLKTLEVLYPRENEFFYRESSRPRRLYG